MGELAGWVDRTVKRVREFAYTPRPERPRPIPKVGMAFGGGFARGIAHIGVLRVLEEQRIPLDFLAGTSVGAVVAAAYAGGAPLAEMERVGQQTRFKDFAEWSVSWQGLASSTRLKRYLGRLTPVRRFESLRIPLTIVASDLLSAESVYFTSGEIGPALCASCAYPGLFRPIAQDGKLLVDGFVTSPVPTDAVRRMGAEFVIAVNLSGLASDERPTNFFEIISRTYSILASHAETSWRPLANVVIEPKVTEFHWDDFARATELIRAGEQAARQALPSILEALQPHAAASAKVR